ncbi:CPBP family intramembrane metalloprotease domain-containing protein [Pantoea endophytica]|uniref:CPBP family intramembrane glutamic endopeptidase n=2 Tax=Pantoea TaxID=53335 RepID=A0AAU7TUX0_9GAMM|nr:CPBP family intramembrane glutamic endopeptidase [Pantoea endophytica]PLR23598.1 CPBP family intramembrane metalloprotease domain-containing protein [Pantoea endophytica]
MWIILAGALAMLSPAKRFSVLLLTLATILGLFQDVLDWPAMLLLGAIAVIAWIRVENNARWIQWVSEVALVAIAIGLFVHFFPGFKNPRQVEDVQAGPLSLPFSFSYNFDKALIPFVLLICLPQLFRTQSAPPRLKILWLALLAAIPLLLYVAVQLGGLAVEPHWPEWLGSFMLANLFFVSLAEEAFFRGYLQQRLRQHIGAVAALLLTSLLFGLAHFPGGPLLMIFATLAGLIYGLAWQWSGRLWVATGIHFLFNMTHLLFFTYPALQH